MALRTYQGALANARTTTGVDRVDLQQIPSLIAVFIYINGGAATVQVEVADQTGAELIPVATVTASTVVVLGVPVSTLATNITAIGAGVTVTSSYRAVVGTEAFSQSLTMFSNGEQIPPSGFVGGGGQPNEIAVWNTTTSLAGYSDFIWQDAYKILNAGQNNTIPAATAFVEYPVFSDGLPNIYVVGKSNNLTGVETIIAGYGGGQEIAVVGMDNIVPGPLRSFVFGWSNTLALSDPTFPLGGGTVAVGNTNTVYDGNHAYGSSNTVGILGTHNSGGMSFGKNNANNWGMTYGDGNFVDGNSFAVGEGNSVQDSSNGRSYGFGDANDVTGDNTGPAFAFGNANFITKGAAFVFGDFNAVTGRWSYNFGRGLAASSENAWALGTGSTDNFGTAPTVSGNNSGLIVAGKNAATDGALVSGARSILIAAGAPGTQQTLADNDTIKLESDTIVMQSIGLAAPSTLQNGMWWVEATGTTPTRVAAIKLRDGGVTKTIASITY